MDYYQLPSGDVAGYDNPAQAPAGATAITAEQFANATAPVLTAARVRASLYAACQAAIVGGFTSAALGSAHGYPATVTDQANQQAVAACAGGGLLYCADGVGGWALVLHTQAQAQQVVTDFVAWLNACQTKLAALTAQASAAQTAGALAAITWAAP